MSQIKQGWARIDDKGNIIESYEYPSKPTEMENIQKYIDRNTFKIGDKVYGRCSCGAIVQLNKPFFGSLHFCQR